MQEGNDSNLCVFASNITLLVILGFLPEISRKFAFYFGEAKISLPQITKDLLAIPPSHYYNAIGYLFFFLLGKELSFKSIPKKTLINVFVLFILLIFFLVYSVGMLVPMLDPTQSEYMPKIYRTPQNSQNIKIEKKEPGKKKSRCLFHRILEEF